MQRYRKQYLISIHDSQELSLPVVVQKNRTNGDKRMSEYLVLMKLNPSKIIETLDAIRNTDDKPLSGVDLLYSMNIFGSWDVAVWINADNNSKAADFVQKKINDLDAV